MGMDKEMDTSTDKNNDKNNDMFKCITCDSWWNPIYLDQVLYHTTGACAGGREMGSTGIVGVRVDGGDA
jgi:hypothetical protein